MFEEVNNIIDNYDRDRRSRAEELYQEMFLELQALDSKINKLHESDKGRNELLKEIKKIAERMQALNYAVCVFEHEKLADLAEDCPPTYGFGSNSAIDTADSEASLLAWLRLHFPHTWPG